jgi:hypothetical protein
MSVCVLKPTPVITQCPQHKNSHPHIVRDIRSHSTRDATCHTYYVSFCSNRHTASAQILLLTLTAERTGIYSTIPYAPYNGRQRTKVSLRSSKNKLNIPCRVEQNVLRHWPLAKCDVITDDTKRPVSRCISGVFVVFCQVIC